MLPPASANLVTRRWHSPRLSLSGHHPGSGQAGPGVSGALADECQLTGVGRNRLATSTIHASSSAGCTATCWKGEFIRWEDPEARNLFKDSLCCDCVTLGRQHERDAGSDRCHGPAQVGPPAINPNVSSLHTAGPADGRQAGYDSWAQSTCPAKTAAENRQLLKAGASSSARARRRVWQSGGGLAASRTGFRGGRIL